MKHFYEHKDRVFTVSTDRQGETAVIVDRIKVKLDEDKYFTITMNYEGALVINKTISDNRESSIIIKPSVSNEVTIL